MRKGRKTCSYLSAACGIASIEHHTSGFSLTPPPQLGGFAAICGPSHCTVLQPFLQPADEPHPAVRADLCQGLGCGTPQIPPCCSLVVMLLPVGYGAPCIGIVALWLEAILQLVICEAGAGFLMDLQLVLAKMGKSYLLSCEMKLSKHGTDNRVTRKVY